MATPIPSLQEQAVSGNQFASAVEAVKTLHIVLASVMADLAAIRRTILDDPVFAEQYPKHLRETSRTTRPLVAEAIEHYDQMIALGKSDAMRH